MTSRVQRNLPSAIRGAAEVAGGGIAGDLRCGAASVAGGGAPIISLLIHTEHCPQLGAASARHIASSKLSHLRSNVAQIS